MSRGGRGGFGGGRGGGRGGFNNSNPPPMGLTFADIQGMSKEPSALYPPMDPLPSLTEYTETEKRICELQLGFAARMRKSAYWVVEQTKSTELPRYSDKYRPSTDRPPALKRKDLHQPFFPTEVFEDYFNPRKKRKVTAKRSTGPRTKLEELEDDGDDPDKDNEGSDQGSHIDDEDYDVDEEYDNDYAENYFDNGEGDDMDDLGGGGGDEGGGGFADYD
ncbi:hypothetical protein PUNSTDRAFT_114057 [Punctularia strigosozonata HHB-11173 SS5]|uniref:uncharacterized protein n=1 Tax=Punctularia strigosozonata (strain HHB-11173) TaxID=741275 RepID=UPI0004416498|nr:uncharacterized protein PUNSTDRAFT_114057 [Punctularia strigosozonata HHB-11173 SS5]EIN08616.1 hypothetical protein PUNSTDRAFT_114057 [Punctularia strigosozonata HHB-11173 SS5]